jgi:hypothetical protein
VLCEAIRIDADRKIQDIPKTAANVADIRQQQMAVILKAREDIGKVVFVADRFPAKVAAGIDHNKVDDSLVFVSQLALAELEKVRQNLLEKNNAANAFPLQDPDMVLFMEKPKEIAKLLLTSQGQLNLGLISTLKTSFFSSSTPLLEYDQGMLLVLSQIDVSWQKPIDAIQVPASGNLSSTPFIRADLGLKPSDGITKLHCQQEVLGALLSQLCQGATGDCFAVAYAIKKHDEFLSKSMGDYSALIRNGYLTRMVNGVSDDFFFETTVADEARQAAFTLNSDGKIDNYNQSFWKCPNLIAACRQMGIEDLEQRAPALLQEIFASDATAQTKSWDDLIQLCAKSAANADHSQDELLVLGRYGFSFSSNRLLRAIETSFAGMAEARAGDYVRNNITSCVMQVFNTIFANNEKQTTTSYSKALIEEMKKVFQTTLNDSFRLVYDGAIPLQRISSDGSSSSGGFELYQRDVQDLGRKGIRIATPEQFKTFVLGVLDQAVKTEMDNLHTKKDRQVIASVSDALTLCAHGKDFMRNILGAYDDANQKVPDPVKTYRDLERTPMTSLDGDNPWEVMAIDTGRDFTPDIKTIRPKDPEDLLKWLLGLAQWKQTTEHYLTDRADDGEDPATSPQHAFNIEFKNKEFQGFLTSKLSPDAWIKRTIVNPGFKVSMAVMDGNSKKAMEQNVRKWLDNEMKKGIPDSLTHEIDTLFSTLGSRGMSIHQYAQRLQDGLVKVFQLKAQQSAELSYALDGMLIQSLPADDRQAIQLDAVRFAKTNWDSGPKNLYFCCYFNPRTEKVDFANIAEDHTALTPMDQLEWIDEQDWGVDPQ